MRTRPRRPSFLPGVSLLGAAVVVALGVAVESTRHVVDSASSPLVPSGEWRTLFWLAIATAFVAYAASAVMSLRIVFPRTPVTVIACLVQVMPLASPLLLSTDVYTYWDYGRLHAAHHANPYLVTPSAFPHDPAYAVMGGSWRHSTSIYGPLFTWVSELVARLASSAHGAEFAFRWLSAAAMLAIVLTLWRSGANASSIVLVGWSPLFALHFAGGGHNDSLMMALAVAGGVASRRRPVTGMVFWVAAVAVKWIAAVFLLLEILRIRGWRDPRLLVRFAGVTCAAVVLTSIEYGKSWLSVFSALSEQSRRMGSLGAAKWLADLGVHHRETVVVLTLTSVAFVTWLAVRAYTRRARHLSIAGTGLAACQGWLNPWYALWGGALLEFEDFRLVAVASNLLLSAIVLRDALPL